MPCQSVVIAKAVLLAVAEVDPAEAQKKQKALLVAEVSERRQLPASSGANPALGNALVTQIKHCQKMDPLLPRCFARAKQNF